MGASRMLHLTDLQTLTLTGIAHRCAQETELFFQRKSYNPRYCFELFRRAIMERNQRAWEVVYNQYRSLVGSWVERHSAFPSSGEETQYFVNRAFEKMWVAVTPDRFGRFPDLKSLLRYLQTCVHSVVLDQVRVAEQAEVGAEADIASVEGEAGDTTPEDQALARVQGQELWDQISKRLHNDKERRVMYDSFVLALKPREIYAEGKDMFRDVREVYRVKENVLARLRRDAELKKLLGADA
jgi:DNA-directed RNA polymerase specialized sigma24 family protein